MTTPEFPPSQPATTPSPLASWGRRAGGYIIDLAPIWILEAIFFRNTAIVSLLAVAGIAYTVYLGYLDGVTGQTPGKAIMGIRLVNQSGQLIGSGAGIGRKFLHIVDALICGLGYLLPLVDAHRQTIADKIMTTYVIDGVEKRPFSLDLWSPPKS